jgi:capsular polysaccharide biosynthesis protein
MGRLNEFIKSVFWSIQDDGCQPLHHLSIKPFETEKLNFQDQRVADAVRFHNEKWFHNELVIKAHNATVEPQYCYAVDGLRTIIGGSIRTRSNLPSPVPMLKARLLRHRKNLKKAILFDGSMGINYFHFLSDVLHKMYLLEEYTAIDCPILVGKAVWSKPFFQYFIKDTALNRFDWQPVTEPVKSDELWIARPLPYRTEFWQKTKQLFIQDDHRLPDFKAIFVNRSSLGTRHISNFDVLKPILENLRASIIDPGSMNVREQAELFNSATHVIGIHGAGMTNVAFSNHQNVKVLELCSNNRIGTQYYWLCTALGINWEMMLGSEAESDQSFELDVESFEKRLAEFLAS